MKAWGRTYEQEYRTTIGSAQGWSRVNAYALGSEDLVVYVLVKIPVTEGVSMYYRSGLLPGLHTYVDSRSAVVAVRWMLLWRYESMSP